MNKEQLHGLLSIVVELFQPDLEVTIFEGGDIKESMGCLSEDKYDTYAIAGDKEFAIRKLKNNRVVKEVSFSIDSQCVIRFRMDVSIFSQLKDRIDTIFPKESSSSKGLNKWNEQIDQIIRDYEIEFGKGMKSFSNQDKEAITRIVSKERLLDFK